MPGPFRFFSKGMCEPTCVHARYTVYMSDFLDLSTLLVDPACVVMVPATLALRRLVLPLSVVEGTLCVAMADPSDVATCARIKHETGFEVKAFRANPEELRTELLKFYGEHRVGTTSVSAVPDDPVALVDQLLRTALLRHASDIHFDPSREGVRVRFRTDGVLEEVTRLPSALQSAVTSRLKVLAGLDIAERRAPQDGAFTWRMQGAGAQRLPPLDVRLATLPVRHGERLTLRLLETDAARLTFDRLGLLPEDQRSFERVLSQPHGLVLLTGPTGSGKTTTLYAAIQLLLQQRPLNVLTVEDPIEYEIPGVSQAEVDSADKVNFAKALRSLLRHDPDVIMIGEIRDLESLDAAVKAALTGHLVLSTLHTNDAVSAVTRLADMGLAPHLAAATLRLSVAQRLVRALCPRCREAVPMTEAEAAAFGDPGLAGRMVYRPKGCLACAGRGYRGRVGLFELFQPNREAASRIAAGVPERDLLATARAAGMKTLAEDALAKCLSGTTTVQEALRVLGAI